MNSFYWSLLVILSFALGVYIRGRVSIIRMQVPDLGADHFIMSSGFGKSFAFTKDQLENANKRYEVLMR